MNDIKVSILCTTYNHERFIKDALDSFLSQKVDFKTEILIHDDCSTDGTLTILQEYANKNKNIRLFTEKNNQYSKNNFKFINDLYVRAKGDYIAFCEGDDYWIDDKKLQKQVKYLDKKPSYSLCFHPVRVVFENTEHQEYIYPEPNSIKQYSTFELLKRNYIQTNSVLYRRRNYDNLPSNIIPSDWYLHLYHAKYGKIGFINEVMSVYRRHEGGVWWKDEDNKLEFWQRHAINHIRFFESVEELFLDDEKLRKVALKSVEKLIDEILFEVGNRDGYEVASNIALNFPHYAAMLMTGHVFRLNSLNEEKEAIKGNLKNSKLDNENLKKENLQLRKIIDEQSTTILEMVNSKSWKLTKPLRSINKRKNT